MTPNDHGILDVESTLERLKGDREFLLTLYGVYIEDLPQKLAAINEAAGQGNLDNILRTAHSLKGASATIGAPAIREAALAVESAARSGDIQTAIQNIQPLESLSRTLLARLQEEIDKG